MSKSKIDSEESAEGLFVYTIDGKKVIPGTLLGFFPGVVYPSRPQAERAPFSLLQLANGNYLSINELIPFPNFEWMTLTQYRVLARDIAKMRFDRLNHRFIKGEQVNCYALGHKINHPASAATANVIPLTINIRRKLLPQYLLRYLPSVLYMKEGVEEITFTGFFATQFIPSGSELFMNYVDAFELKPADALVAKTGWLQNGFGVDEEYLIKREYYMDIPRYLKRLAGNSLPNNMREEFSFEHEKKMQENSALMQKIIDKDIKSQTGNDNTSNTTNK